MFWITSGPRVWWVCTKARTRAFMNTCLNFANLVTLILVHRITHRAETTETTKPISCAAHGPVSRRWFKARPSPKYSVNSSGANLDTVRLPPWPLRCSHRDQSSCTKAVATQDGTSRMYQQIANKNPCHFCCELRRLMKQHATDLDQNVVKVNIELNFTFYNFYFWRFVNMKIWDQLILK